VSHDALEVTDSEDSAAAARLSTLAADLKELDSVKSQLPRISPVINFRSVADRESRNGGKDI